LELAAASGIVVRGDRLYIVADDELDLGVYDLAGQPLGKVPLLPGPLPVEPAARKAAKPDFEAVLTLPDASLLVLGSGSTPQRMRGAWLRFDHASQPSVQVVELRELYEALAPQLPELNIEGAVVFGDQLLLCNRGNGARRDNALVALNLAQVLLALSQQQPLPAAAVQQVRRVELGVLNGTALSFTDLVVSDGQLLFSAAAEASPNTYDDGVCAGSVLGQLSAAGTVEHVVPLTPTVKIEGLCVVGEREQRRLLAVADADDPRARAPLFYVAWSSTGPDSL
jgi:hypothetical protein